jgi:hypothetical protein
MCIYGGQNFGEDVHVYIRRPESGQPSSVKPSFKRITNQEHDTSYLDIPEHGSRYAQLSRDFTSYPSKF